jgi:DNA-binding PadR family transcriptional regulator
MRGKPTHNSAAHGRAHHGPFGHNHDNHDGHGRGFAAGFGPRGTFGGPGFGAGFGGPGFGAGFPGGPGGARKRRGDVRGAILSLLSERPSNGYGLIKAIAERSGGTWTPSPGSVYPTLQQLVDEALIEATGDGKRPEFTLTAAGTAFVAENKEQLDQLWSHAEQAATAEAGMHQAVGKLMGVVHQFRFAATEEQRAKAVEVLDDARRKLYGILAD